MIAWASSYRDLVVAWSDVTFEHHAGLLYEALPGGGGPMLRFGPTFRDRFTAVSGDRSAVVGLLVAARPGDSRAIPTLVGLATWYVVDVDRWEIRYLLDVEPAATFAVLEVATAGEVADWTGVTLDGTGEFDIDDLIYAAEAETCDDFEVVVLIASDEWMERVPLPLE